MNASKNTPLRRLARRFGMAYDRWYDKHIHQPLARKEQANADLFTKAVTRKPEDES